MNYLDRAQDDLETALLLLSPTGNPTQDPGKFDIAAYHIQQAVEKGLKHILHDLCGISDELHRFRTHNLPPLIRWVEKVSNYNVSIKLKELAVDITGWETQSRYSSSTVSTREEIMNAANCCVDFLESIRNTTITVREEQETNEEQLTNEETGD